MIKRNTKIPIYKIENKLFPNTSKHKKKKLIKRKKELYSLAIKSNTFYKNNLIDMIKGNYLDNIINEINDIHTTDINNSCLIKNGYLTGNEQFISLLTFLIIKTIENFNFIKINKTELLSHIFYNNNNYQFLLVKKYIGNNDNIPYFRYHIKRFIIDGFIENAIELIEESKIIKDFFTKEKIKLSVEIKSIKKVEKILLLLQKVAYSNQDNPDVILLFKNMDHLNLKTTDRFQLRNYYKHAWENIINTYVVQKKEEEIQINNFDL